MAVHYRENCPERPHSVNVYRNGKTVYIDCFADRAAADKCFERERGKPARQSKKLPPDTGAGQLLSREWK